MAACLESVRDAVDEIVVYDTGPATGPWRSPARPAQPSSRANGRTPSRWPETPRWACHGEWVLSIDADERLQADPDVLRAQLAHPDSDVEAYLVAIENLHGPGNPRSVHTAIRVFRRTAATWRHRLHEQVGRRR